MKSLILFNFFVAKEIVDSFLDNAMIKNKTREATKSAYKKGQFPNLFEDAYNEALKELEESYHRFLDKFFNPQKKTKPGMTTEENSLLSRASCLQNLDNSEKEGLNMGDI